MIESALLWIVDLARSTLVSIAELSKVSLVWLATGIRGPVVQWLAELLGEVCGLVLAAVVEAYGPDVALALRERCFDLLAVGLSGKPKYFLEGKRPSRYSQADGTRALLSGLARTVRILVELAKECPSLASWRLRQSFALPGFACVARPVVVLTRDDRLALCAEAVVGPRGSATWVKPYKSEFGERSYYSLHPVLFPSAATYLVDATGFPSDDPDLIYFLRNRGPNSTLSLLCPRGLSTDLGDLLLADSVPNMATARARLYIQHLWRAGLERLLPPSLLHAAA